MRLPLVSLRFARLMRPFLAVTLLLALLAPAGATAAPEENARSGAPNSAATAVPPADAPSLPVPDAAPAAASIPAPVPAAEAGAPTLNVPEGGLALTPFLDYLLDPAGTLDISQVSAPERAADFRPFKVREPLRQAGALWLRFRLAPRSSVLPAAGGAAQPRLDLGDQAPGEPLVWTRADSHPPVPAESEGGLFPLAGLGGGGEVFVRLDGLPGLWFAPALRTMSEAMTAPERRVHPLLLAALTALLLLCLVRSVTERGDGRLWAGILTGAALLHALWGVPATPRGAVIPLDMPGLLAAGVALMLLPHVGRNIMRTRDASPRLDVLLLVLALPGAALAVLPLLPGMAWTARLFSLWPLGAAFALLPALALLARGVPGSGLFSLACLGLVAGGGLALWGVNGTLSAPLWGQAPLAGVVFASLLLAAAAPRSAYADPNDIPSEASARTDGSFPPAPDDAAPVDAARARRLEEILRGPLDALLREACALDQILERPSDNVPLSGRDARQARLHADNLVAATRELSSLVGDLPRLALRQGKTEGKRQVFDLLKLVQSVFADVGEALEKGDLGLSWYMAPHLGRLYKGDRDRLRFVLAMLLADAARASERGAVSLRVRRADMSPNPGHLQFTVADAGSGTPPLRRSSLALAKAWELASDHQGDLFVDSTPDGVEITFSLDCVALADDGQTPRPVPPTEIGGRRDGVEPNPRLVILAASLPLDRQMLAFYLEDQGQDIWEARDAEEAVALYAHTPAALVVFHGRLPEEDIVAAVAAIRAFEGERGLAAAPFLALTLDEEQAERLHQAGCDHSLPLPVVRGEFRAMSLHLASPSGVKPRPSIVPHRIPPTRPRRTPTPDAEPGPQTPGFSPLEFRPAETAAASRSAAPATSVAARPRPSGEGPSLHPVPAAARTVSFPPAPVPAVNADEAPAPAPDAARATPVETAVETAEVVAARPETPPAAPRPAAPPAAAKGLNLPPAPKKRLGWLSGLFKPTPRVTPSARLEEETSDASEWVGEPMPIAYAPERTEAAPASPPRVPADLTPSAAPRSEALPAWYSPYGDDPESSVGEPMPVPARPAEEPAAPHPPGRRPALNAEDAEDTKEAEDAAPAQSPPPAAAHEEGEESQESEERREMEPVAAAEAGGRVPESGEVLPEGPFSATNPMSTLTSTLTSPPTSTPISVDPIPNARTALRASLVHAENVPHAPESEPLSDAGIPLSSVGPGERETAGDAEDAPGTPISETPEAEKATRSDSPPFVPPSSPVETSAGDAVPDADAFAPTAEPLPVTHESAPLSTPRLPVDAVSAQAPERPSFSASRTRAESRSKRGKSRLEDLPFLSLDPNYTPPHADEANGKEAGEPAPAVPAGTGDCSGLGAARPLPAPDADEADDIVELTEADMVDSPLLQQVPDLLRSLDAAVEHAAGALDRQDPWGLINAADRMADRAVAFGLHALSDLALCLKEAGQQRDFDTAAQLLPELKAEVERHRRA